VTYGHPPANRGRRVLAMAAPLFVCEPDGDIRGGAIVLHDLFGITEYTEDTCRWLARTGLLAISPYLYHQRGGPAFDSGERATARGHMTGLTADDMTDDIDAALHYLRARTAGPAVVIGYGMGAQLATWTASRQALAAAVAVDPPGPGSSTWPDVPTIDLLVAERRTPWLGIIAGAEHTADTATLERVTQPPGPPAIVEMIAEAEHGFYRSGTPEHDPVGAAEAQSRIADFLRRNRRVQQTYSRPATLD
jgi:carboxymethylenebutenolidase